MRRPPRSPPLPLHGALPIYREYFKNWHLLEGELHGNENKHTPNGRPDRKSTRLNSSHSSISYSLFFFKGCAAPRDLPLFPYTALFRSIGSTSRTGTCSRANCTETRISTRPMAA